MTVQPFEMIGGLSRKPKPYKRPAPFNFGSAGYYLNAIEPLHSWADALNEPDSDRPKALRLGYAITGALQSEMV